MDRAVEISYAKGYGVTRNGDIYNLSTGTKRKLQPDRRGYMSTKVGSRGNKTWIRAHRAVATMFIPNPNNYPEVNHKDGNPSNNCVDNLEWVTGKQNKEHAWRTGLASAKHLMRPVCQYTLDGEFIQRHESVRAAAKSVGTKDHGSIGDAAYGRRGRRSAYGYKWEVCVDG